MNPLPLRSGGSQVYESFASEKWRESGIWILFSLRSGGSQGYESFASEKWRESEIWILCLWEVEGVRDMNHLTLRSGRSQGYESFASHKCTVSQGFENFASEKWKESGIWIICLWDSIGSPWRYESFASWEVEGVRDLQCVMPLKTGWSQGYESFASEKWRE